MTNSNRAKEDDNDKHDTIRPAAGGGGDPYNAQTVVRQAPPEILNAIKAAKAARTANAEQQAAGVTPALLSNPAEDDSPASTRPTVPPPGAVVASPDLAPVNNPTPPSPTATPPLPASSSNSSVSKINPVLLTMILIVLLVGVGLILFRFILHLGVTSGGVGLGVKTLLVAVESWEVPLWDCSQKLQPKLQTLWQQLGTPPLLSAAQRYLCSSLGLLSQIAYQAGGGTEHSLRVAWAGALLSMLTKIDDEVIDAREFHGHQRATLREKTQQFLDLTLQSLRSASPATNEVRCRLAATLGRELRLLGEHHPDRLEHVLHVIERGWQTQTDAVFLLTEQPTEVSRFQIQQITKQISGDWLQMIALMGTLPGDCARTLSSRELEAISAWGYFVQSADALCDFEKDQQEGLCSTIVGLLLWENTQQAYLQAHCNLDFAQMHTWLAQFQIAEACMPAASDVANFFQELKHFPELAKILYWIHGMLTFRYLKSKTCRTSAQQACFSHCQQGEPSFTRFLSQARNEVCLEP
jgi:hypothetical protein